MGQLRRHWGWLRSGIPARKKKIYIDNFSQKPVKHHDEGLIAKLWRAVWQFSKPMIAAYLAKLLVEHARSSENNGLKTEGRKTESSKGSLKEIKWQQ